MWWRGARGTATLAAVPIELSRPEHRIAFGYAPERTGRLLTTLFALDERLAGIVARTTEPTIGLIRLTWWRDALAALGPGPPPAEPLLVAAHELVSHGLAAAGLADMVEGWAALLDDPDLGDEAVSTHALQRGGGLFALAGAVLAASGAEVARLHGAGEGWARADLARHTGDPARAAAILASARRPLAQAMATGWRRPLRPVAQLAALALDDVQRGVGRWRTPASPARLLRILRFQIAGR